MRSILIVEDELIAAESLALDLKRAGYEITGVVSSGEDAIATVQLSPPDLILMDIQLRGTLDGIETSQWLRTLVDIPMIFLTAYADTATLHRIGAEGTVPYLVKPVNVKVLVDSIEGILDLKHPVS